MAEFLQAVSIFPVYIGMDKKAYSEQLFSTVTNNMPMDI